MNLGGNSFHADCDPHTVYMDIIHIVNELYDAGVERVFVASIIERGKFPHWTGLHKFSFNKMRKSVNRKLKKHLRSDYVDIGKRLVFPRHYDEDKVHPGNKQGGLKLFKWSVVNSFRKAM